MCDAVCMCVCVCVFLCVFVLCVCVYVCFVCMCVLCVCVFCVYVCVFVCVCVCIHYSLLLLLKGPVIKEVTGNYRQRVGLQQTITIAPHYTFHLLTKNRLLAD